MNERRGWLSVDGVEWTDCATLAMLDATPVVDARKPRVTDRYPRIRVKNGRVRTRRVHPDVLRRQMEERKDA
jgi:hypothetical protein